MEMKICKDGNGNTMQIPEEMVLAHSVFPKTPTCTWAEKPLLGPGKKSRLIFVKYDQEDIVVKEVIEELAKDIFYKTVAARTRVLLDLNQQNVTKYYGLAIYPSALQKDGELCYRIASQHHPGSDLSDWAKNNIHNKPSKRLPHEQIQNFLRDLLKGLDYLHYHFSQNRKIVHCDIKPGNLMLTSTCAGEKVVIIDFEGAEISDTSNIPGEMENTCDLQCHTAVYSAPELLLSLCQVNGPVCGKTDIWSVGCVAIQLSTGEIPKICPWNSIKGTSSCEWGAEYSYGDELVYETQAMYQVARRMAKPKLPTQLTDYGKSEQDALLLRFIQSCLIFDRKNREEAAQLLKHAYLTSRVKNGCT